LTRSFGAGLFVARRVKSEMICSIRSTCCSSTPTGFFELGDSPSPMSWA
jgi:hypothetical protein